MNSNQEIQKTVQVIGIGRRTVALFVDYLILMLIGNIVLFTIIAPIVAPIFNSFQDAPIPPTEGNWPNTLPLEIMVFILSFIAPLIIIGVYFVSFWTTKGQTPGKMALGIKVVTTNGLPITFKRAVLRFTGYIVNFIVIWLGFIWVSFDGKRQGWHDKMANTYVVRKNTQFSSTDTITIVPSDTTKSAIVIASLLMVGLIIQSFIMYSILLVHVSRLTYSLF